MNPVESPLALYARLTTGVDPHATPRAIGRAIESGLLPYLATDLHLTLLDAGRSPRQDRRQAAYVARPDAITLGGDVAMVKIAPWAAAASWTEGPPAWLTAAAQWEMAIVGAGRCAVGVYGAGGLWRSGWIGADPDAQSALFSTAQVLLERVDRRDPPPPLSSDLAHVKRVFPEDGEGEIRLTRDHARQWDMLKARRVRRNLLERKIAALEVRLRYAVALHRFGLLPDGRRLKLAVDAGGGRRLVELQRDRR